MAKLEAAVLQMDGVALKPPPPIVEIGKRLRLAFVRSKPVGYSDLSHSELRKLPFAYWLAAEPSLEKTDPELLRLYWTVHLPEALQSSPRRAKRWLSTLFFTYCEYFDSANPEFLDFATRFLSALQQAQGLFAEKLRGMHRTHSFFSPGDVASRLANSFFLDHQNTVDMQLADMLLWPRFVVSGLGCAVFKAGLSLPGVHYKQTQTIIRIMDWNKLLPADVVKTDLRVPFANAMLSHWGREKPADSIKNILIDFFVRVYGDPRFSGHRQFQWHGVAPQAMGSFLNWLTGDTLRGFMKLLQRTADDIWVHRQKFWMAYYEKGCIDEAWLALGYDAFLQASKLKSDEKGMGFGRIESGASNNQSVLLLKIGDLIFTEWSHNGSLRASHQSDEMAPNLYQNIYQGAALRSIVSMDFHYGMNVNPQLVHSNSSGGTWQRKARDFICRHTGVCLTDENIL
jgi:hypothetical protein